jgi:subtilase family serine protease
MHVPHTRRALALATTVGAVAAVTAGALVAAPTASAAPGTVTIASTLPRWLAKAHPVTTDSKTAASAQTVRVYLAPNHGLTALKNTVTALSTPGSASYRHWLTTAQYEATFAPTAASATAVSKYLSGQGLKVTGVEAHRRYVTASGTPAQLGKAFGTTLGRFTHDGQTVTAPTKAAVLPTDVGNQVLTVTGLDTTVQKKSHNDITPDTAPPAGFQNGRPCAINYGNPLATYQADYSTPLPKFKGQTLPYAPCGYTGPQLRAAYETGVGSYGAGATVAITDAYAWQKLASDANTYATRNGDGSYTNGQLTEIPSPTGYNRQALCDPTGWSGEEVLDVEAVHAMAPDAKIRYYASASCFDDDFLDTLARVVDDNKAQLVTNSWSDVEANESAANVAAYEQVFLQGATQGISFFFSSGDNGDELENTGTVQVDYPSSDPYVTGAGGTSTGIANGTLTTQTGWGSRTYSLSANGKSWVDGGYLYGAGGGYSALFNRPTWQQNKVPTNTAPGRAVPDIAMNADPNTGMLIGQTQAFPDGNRYGEYRIGGTSLASPLLAGFFALAVGKSGSGLGLLNPQLYRGTRSTITDVLPVSGLGVVRVNNNNGVDNSDGVSYFVRTFDQDSSLKTAAGWDPVTGLGVPNPGMIAKLSAPPA